MTNILDTSHVTNILETCDMTIFFFLQRNELETCDMTNVFV